MARFFVGVFLLSLGLAGCGAQVLNTDKPTGMYLGGAGAESQVSNVELVETNPPNAGVKVEGISCANKMWETATEANAIEVAKREAAKLGYSKLRIASVETSGTTLAYNCWSIVVATGIAFN